MKLKLYFLLLISFTAFSQNNNFMSEKNTLIWKVFIEKSFEEYKTELENNPKLEITKNSSYQIKGIAKNLKCSCPGIAYFMKEEFDADFIINFEDNKISLSVFNLRFKSYDHYVFESVRSKVEVFPIENHVMKKNGTIKDNNQTKKNLECLDKYFDLIFK